MMDVLYIVGPESGHQNRELRWSLRSLEKFGRNLGRVVVALAAAAGVPYQEAYRAVLVAAQAGA